MVESFKVFLQVNEQFLQKTPGRESFLPQKSKIGQYVKPVRRGTKLYLYLAEMAPTADGGRRERIIQRVNEEEARSYGWKRESYGNNQTSELQEHEGPPRPGPVEQEPVQSSVSASTPVLTTPEAPLKAPPKQENPGEPDQDEFKVVPRPRGFYALEPQRPDLPRGYSMVRTDSNGVTNVYCGLCPGFTCVHVEFMKKWLRTHQSITAQNGL